MGTVSCHNRRRVATTKRRQDAYFLMISACVGLALARPQYYPTTFNGLGYNAVPYAVASPQYVAAPAPVVTYEQNIIPDTAPAPVIPYTPIAVQPAAVPTEYKSQFHSQDELGQFSFGHISADQAHHQVRDFTGAVQGSYTYINAEGEQVVAHYIADSNGFRVSSNDLPVAPTFDGVAPVNDLEAPVFNLEAPVDTGVAPEPVMKTDEVKAAEAEHFRLYAEAAAAAEAAPEEVVEEVAEELPVEAAEAVTEVVEAAEAVTEAADAATDAPAEEVAAEETPAERRKRQVFYTAGAFPAAIPVAPAHQVVHHPEFYSNLRVAPVDLTPAEDAVVAPGPVAPVVTDGELLRIENNPGHAVSYRVY